MNTTTQERRRERIDRGIKVRTDGLYALMSWRELAYLIAPRLTLIAGLLLLPVLMPGMYWQRVISIVCIYALLALSFDFLAHYVGLVSLGGAFFVGIGGYLTALLNTEMGLSPLVTVPTAAVLGGVSLFGGVGRVFPGVLLGAVFIQAVSNSLVSARVDLYLHPLITAAFIFVAVLIDSVRNTYIAKLSRRNIRVEEQIP